MAFNKGTWLGIILVAIGLFFVINKGFYFTTQDNVAQVGNLSVAVDNQKRIELPSIVGGLLIVGGVLLMIIKSK